MGVMLKNILIIGFISIIFANKEYLCLTESETGFSPTDSSWVSGDIKPSLKFILAPITKGDKRDLESLNIDKIRNKDVSYYLREVVDNKHTYAMSPEASLCTQYEEYQINCIGKHLFTFYLEQKIFIVSRIAGFHPVEYFQASPIMGIGKCESI